MLSKLILVVGFLSHSGRTTCQALTKAPATPKSFSSLQFKLPVDYDRETLPLGKNGEAVQVTFDIHIQAINPIKAVDMDFRHDMLMSMQWVDHRLNFSKDMFDNRDRILLPPEYNDKIWSPDPFIVNAKSTDVSQLTQKLISIYVYPNQTVQYNLNAFVTVACSMNYKYYPYDHQVCPMLLESFSYDESKVKYKWSDTDAFTINRKLRMLQFQVTWPLNYEEISVTRYKEGKNFTQLIAYFRFDRLLGNHLIQTFSPCSLVVSLSWFSFWLELNALSARMSLLVTSILTLVTQFSGLKLDLPPVAYIKAVDVWMAGCMIWVFGALGEFVLVKVIFTLTENAKFKLAESHKINADNNSVVKEQGFFQLYKFAVPNDIFPEEELFPQSQLSRRRRPKRPSSSMSQDNNDIKSISSGISADILYHKLSGLNIPLLWKDKRSRHHVYLWKTIDNFSKFLFPITFCFFCCMYWVALYMHSVATAAGKN